MDSKSNEGKTCLLIIDPQVDFHEHGSLAVPGANADSARITSLINSKKFDMIVVTLDTHQFVDIGHPIWWVNENNEEPTPLTVITRKDMEEKKWKTARPEDQIWSLNYLQKLEENKRFQHCIWPYHCIIGTPGHGIVPSINKALEGWARKNNQLVTYIWKGTNPKAEMYSAFRADVEVPGADETKLNRQVLDRFYTMDRIAICGEASSHCVFYSLKDMIDYFDTKSGKSPNITLLKDCTSPVPGFEKSTETMYSELSKKCDYLTMISSKEFK